MKFLHLSADHPRLEGKLVVFSTVPKLNGSTDICHGTSMTVEDVYNTLVQLNMISYRQATPPAVRPSPGQTIKYPKGRKNGIARRHLQRSLTHDDKEPEVSKGPFILPKHYKVFWDKAQVEEYLQGWEAKGYVKLRPEKLQWSPYLLSRNADIASLAMLNGFNGVVERSVSEEIDEELPSRSMSKSPVKQLVQLDTPRRLLRSHSGQVVLLRSPDGLLSQKLDEHGTPSRRKRGRLESSSPSSSSPPPPEREETVAAAAALFDEPLEDEMGKVVCKIEEGCMGLVRGRSSTVEVKSEEGDCEQDAEGEPDEGSST